MTSALIVALAISGFFVALAAIASLFEPKEENDG